MMDNKELPEDMVLIKPKAEFCITAMSSKKEKMKFDHPVFINMCSCKDFEEPKSSYVDDKKRRG
jgi:hypothetical protein